MSRTHHRPYIDQDRLFSNEPKRWRKMMKHKKRRSVTREVIHQVKLNPEDDHIFPLDKKPWIYYW